MEKEIKNTVKYKPNFIEFLNMPRRGNKKYSAEYSKSCQVVAKNGENIKDIYNFLESSECLIQNECKIFLENGKYYVKPIKMNVWNVKNNGFGYATWHRLLLVIDKFLKEFFKQNKNIENNIDGTKTKENPKDISTEDKPEEITSGRIIAKDDLKNLELENAVSPFSRISVNDLTLLVPNQKQGRKIICELILNEQEKWIGNSASALEKRGLKEEQEEEQEEEQRAALIKEKNLIYGWILNNFKLLSPLLDLYRVRVVEEEDMIVLQIQPEYLRTINPDGYDFGEWNALWEDIKNLIPDKNSNSKSNKRVKTKSNNEKTRIDGIGFSCLNIGEDLNNLQWKKATLSEFIQKLSSNQEVFISSSIEQSFIKIASTWKAVCNSQQSDDYLYLKDIEVWSALFKYSLMKKKLGIAYQILEFLSKVFFTKPLLLASINIELLGRLLEAAKHFNAIIRIKNDNQKDDKEEVSEVNYQPKADQFDTHKFNFMIDVDNSKVLLDYLFSVDMGGKNYKYLEILLEAGYPLRFLVYYCCNQTTSEVIFKKQSKGNNLSFWKLSPSETIMDLLIKWDADFRIKFQDQLSPVSCLIINQNKEILSFLYHYKKISQIDLENSQKELKREHLPQLSQEQELFYEKYISDLITEYKHLNLTL